jgi:hypothetical protein
MGITVSGTVTYGKPAFESLAILPGVTVALSEAVIDKAYLTWLDVSKLMATFPQNVKMLGDTVILQGPVAIISSLSPTKRLFMQCALAIAAGVVTYVFIKLMPVGNTRLKASTKVNGVKVNFTRSNVAVIGALATAALALSVFYVAGQYLPTQAGVYFYKQTPFYA